ncbi:Polyketide cyclase / dehydrase and lipid transport [Duganella sp. CF458]|uniref:SRPBCC family protein n=1 Tax=Duganella sp. CF458 TaxID=1884368 RepID=UPI0008E34D56|nr:SRPBCC family protein [Duganella sp. CF458]SFF92291.1 Polyketide cyclase / dehydrase and lipid transport [Duganella sp. CF458]
MLKKISMGLILVVVLILGLAMMQPDSFKVQRSTVVKAPPAKVMAYLNDFHQWTAWSPWEKKDPDMQRTFEGAASGKGAVYAWSGNGEVGQGRMEIVDNQAPTQLAIKLDFIKPFASSNRAEFALQPQGETTVVTWTMTGPSPFVTKVMGVFFNMDKMIGKDFEQGLAQLKEVSEK